MCCLHAVCYLLLLGLHPRCLVVLLCFFLFFFNDTATTEIYTLSLHDALPIFALFFTMTSSTCTSSVVALRTRRRTRPDRKSTRLNSSHTVISYAVFCLKKKKKTKQVKINNRRGNATQQVDYRYIAPAIPHRRA